MAGYRLSDEADADVAAIYEYSVVTFGFRVARTYFADLHDFFDLLAANPTMGRAADDIYPGLRRHTHKSHVIYYSMDEHGPYIERVLHHAQDPMRYFKD